LEAQLDAPEVCFFFFLFVSSSNRLCGTVQKETVVEIAEDEAVPTVVSTDKAVPKDKRQTTPFMTKV
jgi:hypothetical protein